MEVDGQQLWVVIPELFILVVILIKQHSNRTKIFMDLVTTINR